MDPEGRLCELKPDSHHRELVYSLFFKRQWDEMSWTQAKLYDAAQQGKSLTRIISWHAKNGIIFVPQFNLSPDH